MKVAAIYARKSTEQHVSDDAKSVTRQIDNARAFAAGRGWTVLDDHIFVDDGISGAEFERRPGFVALMSALKPRPPFEILVMSEESRLGRSTNEVPYALGRLIRAGVEVWCYRDARKITLDTPMDKFMVSATSFASDMERWLAQQRTTETMLRKAKAGHVTGGKVFGYDNAPTQDGVERRVNPAEAAVVRDIFARYAGGEGFKQIAHALNAKKVRSPRPQRGRPSGWDPGTVRAVLKRPLYRGTLIYNKTKKRDADGARHKGRQPRRDRSEWITLDRPTLRIIEPSVSDAVDKRLSERRNAYLRDAKGRLLGSPRQHGHGRTRHLLAGFIACSCGATFEAVRGYYVCSARRRKGPDVCPSEFSFPVERIDHVFLDIVEAEMLDAPSFIDRLLDATFAVGPDAERARWLEESARLKQEITNLTIAIAQGGSIPELVKQLQDRDQRLKPLEAKLAKPLTLPDRDAMLESLMRRTAEWRAILRGPHVEQARVVLQHLIDLPLRVHNEPKPKWMAVGRPEGLMVGLVQSVASPPGFEPGFQP